MNVPTGDDQGVQDLFVTGKIFAQGGVWIPDTNVSGQKVGETTRDHNLPDAPFNAIEVIGANGVVNTTALNLLRATDKTMPGNDKTTDGDKIHKTTLSTRVGKYKKGKNVVHERVLDVHGGSLVVSRKNKSGRKVPSDIYHRFLYGRNAKANVNTREESIINSIYGQ